MPNGASLSFWSKLRALKGFRQQPSPAGSYNFAVEMPRIRLQDLEARLRQLLEVRLLQALPGQQDEDLLIRNLSDAIEANARADPDGSPVAPDTYTLYLHGSAIPPSPDPMLAQALMQVIEAAASNAGLRLSAKPTLNIVHDPNPNAEAFTIVAYHRADTSGQTQDMKANSGRPGPAAGITVPPGGSFLIVNGTTEVPLTGVVVNVGRRLDNDLILDDPRVSRHHAQLRAIKGQYVIFDLASSSGTFINGQRTSQAILHPGDVISLGGVSLIYGQDAVPQEGGPGETEPRRPDETEPTTSEPNAPRRSPPRKEP